jgi:hypothetical protein
MQFLTPLAFWLALLAIPIILLYMLKLRRKQVQVSSTLLWQQVLREQQANAPWQKLKRNLLLLLQLLILAALIFALARPAWQTRAVASGSVIVLLDASASMNATDVSPSRFEAARKTVRALVDELAGDAVVTIIEVGYTPRALVTSTSDKAVLRQAIDGAQVTQGSADWQSAFALASGAARGDQNITTVIVSDGGLPESGLPALAGEVRYVPIGATGDNLSISALALRASGGGVQLFTEVHNFGDTARTVTLSLYLGQTLFASRPLDLPAGKSASITLEDLPNAPGIYKAHLSDPQNATLDSLPLDDTAFAIYQAASARRVLLVSKGNIYLEQLLAALPGVQPYRAVPAADGTIQIPSDPFDLYVLDGLYPPGIPAGANLLYVNPPPNPLFTVGSPFTDMKNVKVNEHILTRFVDWSNVHVLQAKKLSAPEWADVLIEADAGPLVFAGEQNGQRIAAVGFDLRESDLPLQIAYPILFSNLINYLVPPSAFDASRALAPGEGLSIVPDPGVEQILVATPLEHAFTLRPEANLTFTETDELGYYAVNFISKSGTSVEYFAVNLFDEAESDLRPRETVQVGQSTLTAAVAEKVGQREFWPWLAGLALIVLLIEWQMFHRRNLSTLLETVRPKA